MNFHFSSYFQEPTPDKRQTLTVLVTKLCISIIGEVHCWTPIECNGWNEMYLTLSPCMAGGLIIAVVELSTQVDAAVHPLLISLSWILLHRIRWSCPFLRHTDRHITANFALTSEIYFFRFL